jgi:hypothetical protein
VGIDLCRVTTQLSGSSWRLLFETCRGKVSSSYKIPLVYRWLFDFCPVGFWLGVRDEDDQAFDHWFFIFVRNRLFASFIWSDLFWRNAQTFRSFWISAGNNFVFIARKSELVINFAFWELCCFCPSIVLLVEMILLGHHFPPSLFTRANLGSLRFREKFLGCFLLNEPAKQRLSIGRMNRVRFRRKSEFQAFQVGKDGGNGSSSIPNSVTSELEIPGKTFV